MIKSSLVRKIADTETVGNHLAQKGMIYTYLNPVSYITALKDKELFSSMDGIFADGSLLVMALRLAYGLRVTRRSFDMTSMAPQVLRYANEHASTICVVATKQEALNKALRVFSNHYPNIVWLGCRNGYFANDEEMEREASRIATDNPDFLIVGMGIGKQEQFMLMCKNAGYKGIGFTCGGFIHQTAEKDGQESYYPKWMDKLNLRFLYRMYKEPHTRQRYLKAAFVFPYKFIVERFS